MRLITDTDNWAVDERRLHEDVESTDPPEREAVTDAETRGMSPKMLQLILSFDANSPLKRRRARDARGRFVSVSRRDEFATREP